MTKQKQWYSVLVSRRFNGRRLSCGWIHVVATSFQAAHRKALAQAREGYEGDNFKVDESHIS